MNRTLAPRTRLTEIMINQITTLIHLRLLPRNEAGSVEVEVEAATTDGEVDEEMRSSEMAKEVLLHAAPMIMKEPAKLEASSIAGQFSGGMSQLCRPNPKWIDTVIAALPSWRTICVEMANHEHSC